MRMTAVDRTNTFDGKVQIFWGIGKPITFDDTMMFAFSKCGKYLIDRSEGWFYRSDNILTESDPNKIEWQLLPDGDVGLKNPDFGDVQAEQNIVPMNDGSIYCMYRTAGNHPCHAYSRDGGHTWTVPEYATYTPGGRTIQELQSLSQGLEDGQRQVPVLVPSPRGTQESLPRKKPCVVERRNREGRFHSLVAARNRALRLRSEELPFRPGDRAARTWRWDELSGPDRTGRQYWITETQKTVARVHPIDPTLLEGLWNQGNAKKAAEKGLVLGPDLPTDPTGPCRHASTAQPGRAAGSPSTSDQAGRCASPVRSSSIAESHREKVSWSRRLEHGTIRIEINDGQHSGGLELRPRSDQARPVASRGDHRRRRPERYQLRRRRCALRRRRRFDLRLGSFHAGVG